MTTQLLEKELSTRSDGGKQPRSRWVSDLRSETLRVLYTCASIAQEVYLDNQFVVLPALPRSMQSMSVILPKLTAFQSPLFWKRVRAFVKRTIPVQADDQLIQMVEPELASILAAEDQPIEWAKLQRNWRAIAPAFYQALDMVIPGAREKISLVTIIPTRYGTRSSFSAHGTFPANIAMYLRQDATVRNIAEGIVSALTRADVLEHFKVRWDQAKVLVDWILERSSVALVLRGLVKVDDKAGMRKQQIEHIFKKSKNYCKEAWIPFQQDKEGGSFEVLDNSAILVGGRQYALSYQEYALLQSFLSQRGQTVSYDILADAVFPSGSFSLFALAKAVQRLRTTMRTAGLDPGLIQSVRGVGYVLR
jgi:hypothetical protein